MTGDGESVRYLGSMLMPEDEVVLCFFEGSAATVRLAAQRAEVPFERILESGGTAWPRVTPPSTGRRSRWASGCAAGTGGEGKRREVPARGPGGRQGRGLPSVCGVLRRRLPRGSVP